MEPTVPNNNNSTAELTASVGKAEKMRPFDLPRFKRWFGVPPFVTEQEEADFDEFVLSFERFLDPMDTLISQKLYEFALEKYKIIQLLNMSAQSAKQQAVEFEKLEEAAARDRQQLDRKGDPDHDAPTILREFFTSPSIAADIPIDAAAGFSSDTVRKDCDVETALRFEASLGEQLKIDASISGCMRRAKELLRQIKTLSYELAQRLEAPCLREIIEKVHYGKTLSLIKKNKGLEYETV